MEGKLLLRSALALYASSWFLPAHEAFGNGYECFRLALNSPSDDVVHRVSALTNIAFVGAAWVSVTSKDKIRDWMMHVCGGCALMNLVWIAGGDAASLRIGYFLWLAAFFVLAVALAKLRPVSLNRQQSMDQM